MGISPRRSGEQIHIPPDSPQNRWGDWITGLEGAGETGGGVVAEIDSKAESSNTGTSQLAGDLTALESRVEILEGSPPAHNHPQSSITGLVVRLESIEQRLTTIEGRLDAAGIPPTP